MIAYQPSKAQRELLTYVNREWPCYCPKIEYKALWDDCERQGWIEKLPGNAPGVHCGYVLTPTGKGALKDKP